MERTIFAVALLTLVTIWLFSSPQYSRHDLIKNSEVIAYVNVDNFHCTKSSCSQGNSTIENSADAYPVYAVKGQLNSKITIKLPVT